MAATFAALSEDPDALKATISSGPPTLAEGTAALREQRPVPGRLRRPLGAAAPGCQRARRRAADPQRRAHRRRTGARADPADQPRARPRLQQARSLVYQPQTKTTLLRLRETFGQAAPAAKYIAPYQTVCNLLGLLVHLAPRAHQPADNTGTTQRVSVIGMPWARPVRCPASEAPLGGYSGIRQTASTEPCARARPATAVQAA